MSTEFMLDPKDKDLFIAYCRRQAENAKGMINVMDKAQFPDAMMDREKKMLAAYAFVAADLESFEAFSVGGSD